MAAISPRNLIDKLNTTCRNALMSAYLAPGETLVARAHKGEGFRISTAVRDRVIVEKSSVLVRDAQLDGGVAVNARSARWRLAHDGALGHIGLGDAVDLDDAKAGGREHTLGTLLLHANNGWHDVGNRAITRCDQQVDVRAGGGAGRRRILVQHSVGIGLRQIDR